MKYVVRNDDDFTVNFMLFELISKPKDAGSGGACAKSNEYLPGRDDDIASLKENVFWHFNLMLMAKCSEYVVDTAMFEISRGVAGVSLEINRVNHEANIPRTGLISDCW